MTLALSNYIRTISNCSYKALKEWEHGIEDYPHWLMRHQHYSGRINRAFIKAFKNSVKFWPKTINENILQQELLDFLYEILLDHYKYRAFLLKKRWKSCSKGIFIKTSLVRAYYFILVSLVKSLASMAKYYSLPNELSGKKLVIARNFPSHAFSITKQRNKSTYSFGSYLQKKLTTNERRNIISIDEYTRPSKAKEINTKPNVTNFRTQKPCSMPRKILKSRTALFPLLDGAKTLIALLCRNVCSQKKSLDLLFLIIRRQCSSSSFLTLSQEIKKNGSSISKNFVIGFSRSFLYPINTDPPPKEFIYSINFWNPPRVKTKSILFNNKNGEKFRLDKIPLGVLALSRSAVGFSDEPKKANMLKKLINRNLRARLPTHKLVSESFTPVQLGYETEINLNTLPDHQNVIVLFDTPPDSRDGQIGRSIFGDLTHDFFVVRKFLEDIVGVAASKDFVIFHKPKYSFENYIFQYRNLVDKLKKKYEGSYHHISPYSSVAPLLTTCRASFSFIGSSTHVISKKYCRYSFVYIPNSIITLADKNNQDIIAGRNELSIRLDEIKKKTRYVKSRR